MSMTVTEIVVQTQPSALEWIAAIATGASALVIAWQAWMTRKSVQASENAVEVAQAALTESQLARVESGVPRITVSTDLFAFEAHKLWYWDGKQVNFDEDHVFKVPRDADVVALFPHKLKVRNDGPGTVVPKFRTDRATTMRGFTEPIPPGTEKEFFFSVRHTVAEWIALLKPESQVEGRDVYPICARLDVIYSGPRDADVDETHPVIVRGSALVPIKDAEGDWRRYSVFETEDSLSVRVAPATRTYWRSRSANLQFESALPSEQES